MKLQAANSTVKTQVMDHHGIVASVCKDLKIAERINSRIGSKDPRRVIQPGTAMVSMIINALGFTNRRLYLTPQFYQSKAVEHLLGDGVQAKDLDDHCLGKCLDEISSYGVTKLYGETVFELAVEHNLLGKYAHLDSTSFVLQGAYGAKPDTVINPLLECTEVIEVVHGYSKDHRPDLKQVMLSLSVSGEANIPIWMEPLSGNSSDKSSFHETISNVRLFQSQLKLNHDFIWVADSALYTADKLLSHNNMLWVSRVPENIKDCTTLLELEDNSFSWEIGSDGYYSGPHCQDNYLVFDRNYF
jgi:transposase